MDPPATKVRGVAASISSEMGRLIAPNGAVNLRRRPPSEEADRPATGAIIDRKEVTAMTSQVEVAVAPVRDLSPEESRAFFDAKARELMGISGEEFIRRWNAGEYDEIADDPAHSDIMYLAILGNAR